MRKFWFRMLGRLGILAVAGCASIPDISTTKYSLAPLSGSRDHLTFIDKRTPSQIDASQRRMLLPDSMFEPPLPVALSGYLAGSLPAKLQGLPIELLEAETEARLIGGVGPSRGFFVYDLGAAPAANVATNAAGTALAHAILSRDRLIFETSIRLRVGGNEFAATGVAISSGLDREEKARESAEKAFSTLREHLSKS